MQNTEISPATQRLLSVLAGDECWDWGNLQYANPRTIAAAVLRETAQLLDEQWNLTAYDCVDALTTLAAELELVNQL